MCWYNTDELKITKIRHYRINFRYNGVLYSLNHNGEDSVILRNMDNKTIAYTWYCGTFSPFDYCKINGKGIVYKHIDKEYFLKQLLQTIINECQIKPLKGCGK